MQEFKYEKLASLDAVVAHVALLNLHRSFVVIDVETTGLDQHTDHITDVVISGLDSKHSVLIPRDLIAPLASLTPPLVFHNAKFDLRMLLKESLDFRNRPMRDTVLLHHLIDEEASHKLEDIILERYQDDYKQVFWSTYKNFQDAPEAAQLEYACKDVIYTDLLFRDLQLELRDQEIPQSLVEHVHRLAKAFLDTEMQGITVDLDYLTALAVELKPKILLHRKEMREMVDAQATVIELEMWAKQVEKAYKPRGTAWQRLPKPDFNFDAHGQVGTLLYDKLKLPEQQNKVKVKGGPSEWRRTTDDDALERIQHLHPIVPKLREYAGYQKVYTAFVEGTLERLHNGRIYPSFNINGTVTGRISSSDPNLQQLPSKGDWAKVRGIYIPDPGHRILSCDYSQLEVVIAAHFSQDKNLLKIVFEGASKHDITAHSLKIDRGLAKTLNFAMQYQCSPMKVAEILGGSQKEGEYIWNKYWETYEGEKRVIEECKRKVDQGEPIINPFGRRRHFKGDYRKPWLREAAYRQAYSSLIQGTGSDCTHYSFYTTAETLTMRAWGRALWEVHDELVISVKESYCTEAADMLKSTMINAGKIANLTVPLSVECSAPLIRWEK